MFRGRLSVTHSEIHLKIRCPGSQAGGHAHIKANLATRYLQKLGRARVTWACTKQLLEPSHMFEHFLIKWGVGDTLLVVEAKSMGFNRSCAASSGTEEHIAHPSP